MDDQQNIIIYRTADGRASVALYAKDGKIWLNQQQMAELFATSKQLVSHHIANILKDKELKEILVVKNFLTTAADGKNYNVVFYSLEIPTKRWKPVSDKYMQRLIRSVANSMYNGQMQRT